MKYVGLYDNNKDIVTKDKLDAVEAAIPTKVSELTNDSGYITADQAPVQSVNNKTGAVSLTASDVSAIPSTLTGTAGQVLTKNADGQEWADAPVDENSVLLKDASLNLPSSSSWTAVAYGNNLFVAVATGTAMGAYSSDGVNWNISTLPVVGNWSAIASNGTWFIAVQTGSNIYIQSSDGINWMQGDFNYNGVLDDIGNPARDWVGIGYGTIKSGSMSNNAWVAINRYVSTWSVTFSIFYSFTSGQTSGWGTPTVYPNKDIDPFSVCFGTLNPSTGRLGFVIFPNGHLIYSSDAGAGLDEGTYTLPASGEWKASAYGNGKFVALMKGSNRATYDTDVFTWNSVTLPLTANWCSAAYGSDKFVAIAENSNTAIYSNDGITWNTTNLPSTQNWKSVVYGNGQFLAVASDSDVVAVSADGINWISAMKKLQYPDGTDIHEQVKEALQIVLPDVPQPSTTTPLMPTEAGSVGTSVEYTRGDHSHPKELFVCTITKNADNYTCDKTFDAILEAYNAGKVCVAKYVENSAQTHICYLVAFYTVQIMRVVIFNNIELMQTTNSNQRSICITINRADKVSVTEHTVSEVPQAIKITLTVADWDATAKTQSVTVQGVLSDATKQEIRVMPVNAALDSPYITAGVQCVAQGANSLTFGCETVPTEAIEVYVVMQNVQFLS